MTESRCMGCAHWFDKKLGACPECGWSSAYNSHADKTRLDRDLFAKAEHAEKERKLGEALRSGREPDPPRWARQKAREIVRDL